MGILSRSVANSCRESNDGAHGGRREKNIQSESQETMKTGDLKVETPRFLFFRSNVLGSLFPESFLAVEVIGFLTFYHDAICRG